MQEPEPSIAWTATPYRAPVLDRAGNQIGRTDSLLGDEQADIFHGIAVRRPEHRRIVEISADHIVRITSTQVHTDLDPAAVSTLPDYHEERWLHLGWGGLFRKRPEWRGGE